MLRTLLSSTTCILSMTVALLVLLTLPSDLSAQRVLFDARHGQTAGNADWIVDADSKELSYRNYLCQGSKKHSSAQRFPTPPQSEITLTTPETIWHGGISAWAVDLAKDALDPARGRDWQIEQYPWNAPPMTYGDPSNEQDLSLYDVLILCEPNEIFEDSEAQAILEFVANGGGLFLVADHETSDRNCSGDGTGELHDSPYILNRLMKTAVETTQTAPYYDAENVENDYGVFGIWFYENGVDNINDGANRQFDWFSEDPNDNVISDPDDPIIRGPFGDGSEGLGLHGSTQMAVSTDPTFGNPSARAHIFRNGQSQQINAAGVYARATMASATLTNPAMLAPRT